jgi:hypothetical protein
MIEVFPVLYVESAQLTYYLASVPLTFLSHRLENDTSVKYEANKIKFDFLPKNTLIVGFHGGLTKYTSCEIDSCDGILQSFNQSFGMISFHNVKFNILTNKLFFDNIKRKSAKKTENTAVLECPVIFISLKNKSKE